MTPRFLQCWPKFMDKEPRCAVILLLAALWPINEALTESPF